MELEGDALQVVCLYKRKIKIGVVMTGQLIDDARIVLKSFQQWPACLMSGWN